MLLIGPVWHWAAGMWTVPGSTTRPVDWSIAPAAAPCRSTSLIEQDGQCFAKSAHVLADDAMAIGFWPALALRLLEDGLVRARA